MIVLITCSTNYRFTEVFTQLNVAEFVNLIFHDSRAVFVQGQHLFGDGICNNNNFRL